MAIPKRLAQKYNTAADAYIFPSTQAHRPLSNMSIVMLSPRIGVAEASLAHAVGNEVERAYRRGDALNERRKLMTAWAAYLVKAI